MHVYYADSSVLVKRHVIERGSSWIRNLAKLGPDHIITSSRISEVEVCSALSRRMREASLAENEYHSIVEDFSYACTAEHVMIRVSGTVIDRAKLLLVTPSTASV